MTEVVHDPVSRVRMAFEPQGENLLVDVWLEPGGSLPAHLHPVQEERWSVIEGTVQFQLGDDKLVLGPEDGEKVVPPNTVHGLTSISDRDAHLRCLAVPALRLQAF